MGDIEYDLAGTRLASSPNPYVRFGDLLPVEQSALLPSDSKFTPAVHATRLGNKLGLPWLFLKDETKLPTGTTKDRMADVSLPFLFERGVRGFCTSSTGNSSTAYARAVRRFPRMKMFLFTAERFVRRVQAPAGAEVVHLLLRDATFVEAFDAARAFADEFGLVSERGFFNPGRREGLKLAMLEAVEQVPRPIDWYVQAVSSAMGVYGAFKGAKEMLSLQRIDRLPRLLCVQQETCAPMVAAWNDGSDSIRPEHVVHRPTGIAASILRGNPSRAYPYVRKLVIESRGTFVSVGEEEIRAAREWIEDLEGISVCFSSSAALAGAAKLARAGGLPPGDTILVNLTGSDRPASAVESSGHWLRRSGSGWIPEDPSLDLARLFSRG
jgi:threonine synthase